MNPYWAVSIDDMIAGLSSWSITRLFATFESVAVSKIGCYNHKCCVIQELVERQLFSKHGAHDIRQKKNS